MRSFRTIAQRLTLGLLALLVIAAITVRIGFDAYLKSAAFRTRIGNATARALKAEGAFLPFHFAGATVYSDGFAAHGTDAAFFSDLRAEQMHATFDWHGMLHRKWQIDEIEMERLDIRVAQSRHAVPAVTPNVATRESPPESMPEVAPIPKTGWPIDLKQARVRDSRWSWGGDGPQSGTATGASLKLTPAGEAWLIDVVGGRVAQTGWPEVQIDSVHLRYQSPSIFVTESSLRQGEGRIAVTGEIDPHEKADLTATLTEIDVAPFLGADWRARLTGRLSAEIKVRVPLGSDEAANFSSSGSAQLIGGQLTALPVLDQVATFTQTQRFRKVAFTQVTLDFTETATNFTAKHLIAESAGLLRVEGDFTINAGQIDGSFEVGVTSTSLQWLPGSRARVFTVARGGYLWAPMRLSGPVEHPKEDLTSRLAQAAAGEVIQGVESTVRDATKGVLETGKGVLDRLLR